MENKTTPYILRKDGNYFVFPSEGAACEYLDVKPCSVASCFRSGSKCKGYEVIRAYSELDLYNDPRLRKIWESMHERCEISAIRILRIMAEGGSKCAKCGIATCRLQSGQ